MILDEGATDFELSRFAGVAGSSSAEALPERQDRERNQVPFDCSAVQLLSGLVKSRKRTLGLDRSSVAEEIRQ